MTDGGRRLQDNGALVQIDLPENDIVGITIQYYRLILTSRNVLATNLYCQSETMLRVEQYLDWENGNYLITKAVKVCHRWLL